MAVRVMVLLAHEPNSFRLIDPARCVQDAVRPQRDGVVTDRAREARALAHEPAPQSQAPGLWLDEQEPEAGNTGALGVADQEDAPGEFSIDFGDPATLPRGVVMSNEVSYDLRHQSFELLVPAELLMVEHTMTVNDPPHVSGTVAAHCEDHA